LPPVQFLLDCSYRLAALLFAIGARLLPAFLLQRLYAVS
jgi:hypothetical protein